MLPSVRQREIWPFLSGVFLICSCGLMLQIVQTRIISVILYYHLAFFAISMAMLGMTAGSLLIYFRTDWFPRERLFENLVWIGAAFSISVVLSTLSLITTIAPSGIANTLLMTSVVWLKLILILLPPYVLAGMAISMALGALSARLHRDVSVTTDDRPFFFNQLNTLDSASIAWPLSSSDRASASCLSPVEVSAAPAAAAAGDA